MGLRAKGVLFLGDGKANQTGPRDSKLERSLMRERYLFEGESPVSGSE